MNAQLSSVRALPLAALTLSTTPAQIERRKHLDKAKLAELAESIKAHGLVQPVLVRPFRDEMVKGEAFEVVAGERRVIAARQAGLEEILATVRELTDEQVMELQLIENLQRQDLHELAEAEGYEQLAKLGHSVDDMAAKVGKSRATVYARMKLLALGPAPREAFYRGELSASTALLLARIPDAAAQRKACGEITHKRWGDGSMSYREALEHIQQNYMLRLAEAPFPTDDKDLVAAAGACGACPKRTGNQPELFGDIKGADVCTDPSCFKRKREAFAKRQLEQARAAGQEVITGDRAKKIAPRGIEQGYMLNGGYLRLDDKVYRDPKQRTVRQILGKEAQPTLVQDAKTGDVVPLVRESALDEALRKQGVRATREPSNPEQSRREKKAKAERAFRVRLFDWVLEKIASKLDVAILRQIAKGYAGEMQQDGRKALCGIYSIEAVKRQYTQDYDGPLTRWLDERTEGQLVQFLQVCYLAGDLQVSTWSDAKPERLLQAAKALKIDAAKVRRELDAAEKAKKPAPPKASSKKAKGKK